MSSATLIRRSELFRSPLRYGSENCCLVLSDSRYTREIVALRNDSEINRFIHHDHLTEDSHERWLRGESLKRDSLNFVILVGGRFAGTASLYEIEAGNSCQFGRMVMPNDNRRIFAVAVEFLCLSFAFDVLQIRKVFCKVASANTNVREFHLRNGWKMDARYDGFTRINGSEISEVGFSIGVSEWPAAVQKCSELLDRLHDERAVAVD